MAEQQDQLAARLARIEAQLERLAKAAPRGGIFSGFRPLALGALVGAGVAMLYAPQPGEQTRTMLRRNADELQERATQAASGVKERLPEQLKGAQSDAQAAPDKVEGQAQAVAERGKDTLHSVKAEAKQEVGAAKKAVKQEATNGSPAKEAQAQLQRDLKSGSENPS